MTSPTPTTPKQLNETELAAFKSRYIETADRSYLNERLAVRNLPDHLYGEWVGTDSFSQFNAKARGFVDGASYLGPDNIMHYTPEGGVIGDVKYMVISKQLYNAMKDIDDEKARKQSGIGFKDEAYKETARQMKLGVSNEEQGSTRVLRGDAASEIISKG